MEVINTTKLARKFNLSNRDLETKLKKLGVKPLQSIEISGRKFATWDRQLAETKLKELQGSKPRFSSVSMRQELDEIRQVLHKIETLLEKTAR